VAPASTIKVVPSGKIKKPLKNFRLTFKTGAKYRAKRKDFYHLNFGNRFDNATMTARYSAYNPDAIFTPDDGRVSILNFLNSNYESDNQFLDNRFKYITGPPFEFNLDEVRKEQDEFFQYQRDTLYVANFDNYIAKEAITAGYGMFEMHWGIFTFIPGVRLEKTDIEYKAKKGSVPGNDSHLELSAIKDTTGTNSYTNIFPMIHLKIQPLKWMDIRLAYTKTLSRPDYISLTPRYEINHNAETVNRGVTDLKPELSENYDLIVSFHSNKLGLLSVGPFYKKITNFVFENQFSLKEGSPYAPDSLGYPSAIAGYTLYFFRNNPYPAYVKGFETEWQTSFYYLPRPFNGLVLNLNYTYIDSKMDYVRPPVYVLDLEHSTQQNRVYNVVDSTLTRPLLSQPKNTFNITLGYDYKRFSGRVAYQYQDNIFVKVTPYEELFETKKAYQSLDVAITYRIMEHLKLELNMVNITNVYDETYLQHFKWATAIDNYGWQIYAGLRYSL
jgi:TonB-dependent receptor